MSSYDFHLSQFYVLFDAFGWKSIKKNLLQETVP